MPPWLLLWGSINPDEPALGWLRKASSSISLLVFKNEFLLDNLFVNLRDVVIQVTHPPFSQSNGEISNEQY